MTVGLRPKKRKKRRYKRIRGAAALAAPAVGAMLGTHIVGTVEAEG